MSPFSVRSLTTFLTLAIPLFSCGASAPSAENSAASPPTLLDPLFVQGRGTDLLGTATSASQGIVGARELAARPFLRRGELLEVIPGVVITQHSGGGKANQYFLRGFNLDHGTDFSVSVDGMPVNMRSHGHGQGYADLNFLIPELVQQVHYHKGPFYADVGDFSAAGAAEFRQFDALPQNFVSLSLGENRFARLVVGGSQRGQASATTGAFEVTHDDGPWQLREDFNRYNGFVRHSWQTGAADFRLTAMGYTATWNATDQIPLRAVQAGTLDRFGHVDPSNGGESQRASLSFDGQWKGATATTRLEAYAIHYRMNLFSNFTYFRDDPVNGDQFNQLDRRTLVGGALTRTWSASRGADVASETKVGAQVRADFVRELGLHRAVQRVRLSTVRNDEVDEASLGLFAKNATRWNAWLRTEAGVRADGFRFKVESNDARNSGRADDAIFSPKVGMVLGPWARTELYANAGYGFHSNDARGTTIRIDPADGVTPVERVTPLARSKGIEVGLRTTAAKNRVSTVSLWALDLDSELVFVGDGGGTEAADRTRRYGIEVANFWRATPWLTLDADATLTHARYREDAGAGRHIANSIATVVTAGATFDRGSGWFATARLRYFGSQPLIEDASVRAPASTTVNAQVGWRAKRWEVALDVLNVLDRANNDIAYFYGSRLPGEPAAGVDAIHFHPAEPLTLRVNFTRKF